MTSKFPFSFHILLFLCSLLKAGTAFAQPASSIIFHKNELDANGLRQGKWTIYLNKNRFPEKIKDSARFYRMVEYKDNEPIGPVVEYYPDGKKSWEGKRALDKHGQEMETGEIVFYRKDGKKWKELKCDDLGILKDYKEYKADGKTVDNTWKGFLLAATKEWNLDSWIALPYFQTALERLNKEIICCDTNYIDIQIEMAQWYLWAIHTKTMFVGEGGIVKNEKKLTIADGTTSDNKNLYLEKAKVCLDEAMRICVKILGKNNRRFGDILHHLASYYSEKGDHKTSIKLIEEEFEIVRTVDGPRSSKYAKKISWLTIHYTSLGMISKVDSLYNVRVKYLLEDKSIKGYKKWEISRPYIEFCLKKNRLKIAGNMLKNFDDEMKKQEYDGVCNYASDPYIDFFKKTGEYSKADSTLAVLRMLRNANIHLGMGMWIGARSSTGYEKRAHFGMSGGNFGLAKKFHFMNLDTIDKLTEIYIPTFSDKEKENMYNGFYKISSYFYPFCHLSYKTDPEIIGKMYDVQLNKKAYLLTANAKWKERIKKSGDIKLFGLYTKWEENRSRIANDKGNPLQLDSLEQANNELEKELNQRSTAFASLNDKKKYSWTDVKSKLKKGEAAIEIIRLSKFGVKSIIIDSSDENFPRYPQKDLTDTICYAALIVKHNSKLPEVVFLENGNELELKYLNFYKNAINKRQVDDLSYHQYWDWMKDKLKGIKTVYFSPEGVFNQINLNTLYNPKNGKFLIDEMDIRLLTGTKDLLIAKNTEPYNNLFYLVGFPNYNYSLQKNKATNAPILDYKLDLERSAAVNELPGTKAEIEKISEIAKPLGFNAVMLQGDKANEETIKDCFKPRVLHIATHGYFEPDAAKFESAMLRSGLLLAGANQFFKGEKNEGEDGILTAYEAMNLNLDNTDLVVLSACETGLGEMKNGEGVYGLQRAFKVAGAKTLIMSLWKVDDAATQELMVSFYKNWLNADARLSLSKSSLSKPTLQQAQGEKPSAGSEVQNSKRQAFQKAQKELRLKYPNPFHWGAFVMVGE